MNVLLSALTVFSLFCICLVTNAQQVEEPSKVEEPVAAPVEVPEKETEAKSEKESPKKTGDERLSELFQKAWKSQSTLSDDENAEFMKLIPTILPGKDYLGDDLEWRLLFKDSDNDDSDLLTVNLAEKGTSPYARKMWFHITYKAAIPAQYGNEEFEGFRAMGLPGVHLLVLAGHIEIRAVAATDAYKRQSKIDEVLKAFPLKKISKL